MSTQQTAPPRELPKWKRDMHDDPDHWLARAEEARAMGSDMSEDGRRTMEGIALGYEYLARQAERRRRMAWSET